MSFFCKLMSFGVAFRDAVKEIVLQRVAEETTRSALLSREIHEKMMAAARANTPGTSSRAPLRKMESAVVDMNSVYGNNDELDDFEETFGYASDNLNSSRIVPVPVQTNGTLDKFRIDQSRASTNTMISNLKMRRNNRKSISRSNSRVA